MPVFSNSRLAIKSSGFCATSLGIIVVRETGIPHPANKIKLANNANLIMRRTKKFASPPIFKPSLTTTSAGSFFMKPIEHPSAVPTSRFNCTGVYLLHRDQLISEICQPCDLHPSSCQEREFLSKVNIQNHLALIGQQTITATYCLIDPALSGTRQRLFC